MGDRRQRKCFVEFLDFVDSSLECAGVLHCVPVQLDGDEHTTHIVPPANLHVCMVAAYFCTGNTTNSLSAASGPQLTALSDSGRPIAKRRANVRWKRCARRPRS